MVTISLCMIVKDEEAVLKRCLESAKEIADEMIVVDTGSRDQLSVVRIGKADACRMICNSLGSDHCLLYVTGSVAVASACIHFFYSNFVPAGRCFTRTDFSPAWLNLIETTSL